MLLSARDKGYREFMLRLDQCPSYFSEGRVSICNEMGIVRSMPRKGDCWDNSFIENFFCHMKSELKIKKRDENLRPCSGNID
ncbi:MAG: hypothetical protein ACTTJW_05385 [Sphaerochaeta sp.]